MVIDSSTIIASAMEGAVQQQECSNELVNEDSTCLLRESNDVSRSRDDHQREIKAQNSTVGHLCARNTAKKQPASVMDESCPTLLSLHPGSSLFALDGTLTHQSHGSKESQQTDFTSGTASITSDVTAFTVPEASIDAEVTIEEEASNAKREMLTLHGSLNVRSTAHILDDSEASSMEAAAASLATFATMIISPISERGESTHHVERNQEIKGGNSASQSSVHLVIPESLLSRTAIDHQDTTPVSVLDKDIPNMTESSQSELPSNHDQQSAKMNSNTSVCRSVGNHRKKLTTNGSHIAAPGVGLNLNPSTSSVRNMPSNHRSTGNGKRCRIHHPTLTELQLQSFCEYIQKTVLPAARKRDDDDDSDGGNNHEYQLSNSAAASANHGLKLPQQPPFDESGFVKNGKADNVNKEDRNKRKRTSSSSINYRITPMPLREGIAKICLPRGFWDEATIGKDRTGRGPAFQEGTPLGDFVLTNPIQQHVRGMAGIYEYTFTDYQHGKDITLAQFRVKADQYRKQVVGYAVDKPKSSSDDREGGDPNEADHIKCNANIDVGSSEGTYSEEEVNRLERLFWKRLGPTMPPPIYGADMEGTLFGQDSATGWSLAQLDSCLHLLQDRLPGVTTPYLYAGMWASVFCAHSEDMNLFSINYLHAGQPKLWYAIAEQDAPRFMTLACLHYAEQAGQCKEFLRHKRCLLSPNILNKAGIPYTTAVQFPGDAIIAFPGGLHFGFNIGFNLAEATNFALPEWLPFGRQAKVCMCRPDSVRIDVNRLSVLLQKYDADQAHRRRGRKLSWKQWRQFRERDKRKKQEEEEKEEQSYYYKRPRGSGRMGLSGDSREHAPKALMGEMSEQQRKKEFWIEVMQPVSNDGKIAGVGSNVKNKKRKSSSSSKSKWYKKHEHEVNKTASAIAAKEPIGDVWHLARAIGRKGLTLHDKVLCIMPAIQTSASELLRREQASKKGATKFDSAVGGDAEGIHDNDDDDMEENDDEQCFAGQVVEVLDDHVRIHMDGLPKSEDTWMSVHSPKLFLDGGQWQEPKVEKGLPPLHYWQEMDSKERCKTL